jgi:hypothetical protein
VLPDKGFIESDEIVTGTANLAATLFDHKILEHRRHRYATQAFDASLSFRWAHS